MTTNKYERTYKRIIKAEDSMANFDKVIDFMKKNCRDTSMTCGEIGKAVFGNDYYGPNDPYDYDRVPYKMTSGRLGRFLCNLYCMGSINRSVEKKPIEVPDYRYPYDENRTRTILDTIHRYRWIEG